MYQRKSNLLNVMIMMLDCLCITVSLILANYTRNGKAFVSDNERMDFGLMLGGCLIAFLAWNLYKNLYKDNLYVTSTGICYHKKECIFVKNKSTKK